MALIATLYPSGFSLDLTHANTNFFIKSGVVLEISKLFFESRYFRRNTYDRRHHGQSFIHVLKHLYPIYSSMNTKYELKFHKTFIGRFCQTFLLDPWKLYMLDIDGLDKACTTQAFLFICKVPQCTALHCSLIAVNTACVMGFDLQPYMYLLLGLFICIFIIWFWKKTSKYCKIKWTTAQGNIIWI